MMYKLYIIYFGLIFRCIRARSVRDDPESSDSFQQYLRTPAGVAADGSADDFRGNHGRESSSQSALSQSTQASELVLQVVTRRPYHGRATVTQVSSVAHGFPRLHGFPMRRLS
eukprot:g37893.t1